jgi:hypothetical protein
MQATALQLVLHASADCRYSVSGQAVVDCPGFASCFPSRWQVGKCERSLYLGPSDVALNLKDGETSPNMTPE